MFVMDDINGNVCKEKGTAASLIMATFIRIRKSYIMALHTSTKNTR